MSAVQSRPPIQAVPISSNAIIDLVQFFLWMRARLIGEEKPSHIWIYWNKKWLISRSAMLAVGWPFANSTKYVKRTEQSDMMMSFYHLFASNWNYISFSLKQAKSKKIICMYIPQSRKHTHTHSYVREKTKCEIK